VTFTRASARDLRERLRAGLIQLLETGCYLDFAISNRAPFEQALLELDASVISTIHGFFRSLLRLNAPSLGLDPDFGNLDETQARELFRTAASSVLARAALEGGVGAALLAQHGWEDALWALEMLYQKRVYAPFSGSDSGLLEAFSTAEKLYVARLGNTMLSSTDVELKTLELLSDPVALERIQSRFCWWTSFRMSIHFKLGCLPDWGCKKLFLLAMPSKASMLSEMPMSMPFYRCTSVPKRLRP
jgi:superfamily I DNA/RNA helicase